MSLTVYLALYGWIPVVFGLFMVLPPRRAVIAAFLIAWMFLPMAGFKILYLPDYTKMSATCLGVLLGAAFWDSQRLVAFRPHWVDIPAAVFCLSPFCSSISNGLGVYDGLSEAFEQTVLWGLPYLIGRIYFSDLDGLRELAIGVIIGGLIYLPFCWLEMRMSPQLHRWVYGYHQHTFGQTKRLGGYRPMVFMQHGLMVAMWMGTAALAAMWLWRARTVQTLAGVPMTAVALLLLATAVLCRSAFATMLLLMGLAALVSVNVLRTRAVIVLLMVIPPLFITLRASMVFDGWLMVELSNDWFGPDRARSIETRVVNDNLLSQHALKRPTFGWGGWRRARVEDETGQAKGITDSLWVITLGNNGLVSLVALNVMLLMPMTLVLYDYRRQQLTHPRVAPALVLATVLVLYMIDHLMNAMVNPIYMVATGALGSAHLWAGAQKRLADQVQVVTARPVQAAPAPAGAAWT